MENVSRLSSAIENFDALPSSAFVRAPVVAALFGCCVATVWNWSKAGVLTPKKISPGVTGFNVGELRKKLSS